MRTRARVRTSNITTTARKAASNMSAVGRKGIKNSKKITSKMKNFALFVVSKDGVVLTVTQELSLTISKPWTWIENSKATTHVTPQFSTDPNYNKMGGFNLLSIITLVLGTEKDNNI